MDYNNFLGNGLDQRWNALLQNYFQSFIAQRLRNKSFQEVLNRFFFQENEKEISTLTYEKRENCEKFILDALELFAKNNISPKQEQITLLLNISISISRDPTCFLNLQSNSALESLIHISQPTNLKTDLALKELYMTFLNFCLEHEHGVKWLIETNYWTDLFIMMNFVGYEIMNSKILQLGNKTVAKLLENAIDINSTFCYHVIRLMTEPLLTTVKQLSEVKKLSLVPYSHSIYNKIRPSLICLVKTLEHLLKNQSLTVLKFFIELKVREASDLLISTINDINMSLILSKIVIILSFYEMTDFFDGIKVVKHDPLDLSGFIDAATREIKRGNLIGYINLLYYAQKYSKYVSSKLPKYFVKDKPLEIENELITLQLEPLLLISERLGFVSRYDDELDGGLKMSFASKILNQCSMKALHMGYEVRKLFENSPIQVHTLATELLIKSKKSFSLQNLGLIFEGLIYCFEDIFDYMKKRVLHYQIEYQVHSFLDTLLKVMLEYIESFDLTWRDTLKVTELPTLMYDFLSLVTWPSQITVKALNILEMTISKRMSPSMTLLLDTTNDSSLNDIGPLLYMKCFNSEWEIRKAVLNVIYIISVNANKSFSSFRKILTDASLPSLVTTMALNDAHPSVRSTAFKCLQEIILMEDLGDMMPRRCIIKKILDVLYKENEAIVKKEIIILIRNIYTLENVNGKQTLMKMYKCMEHVALNDHNSNVQMEAVEFWRTVVRTHLATQGWLDRAFPPVVFSKEQKKIVTLNKNEVKKRIFTVLSDLSDIGCLDVFVKVMQSNETSEEVMDGLSKSLSRFLKLFGNYEINPDNLVCYQEYFELWSIQNSHYVSPSAMESDQVIQEIIDNTLNMLPDNQVLLSYLDTNNLVSSDKKPRISPSEFVEFTYKMKAASQSEPKDLGPPTDNSVLDYNDLYNIIDY